MTEDEKRWGFHRDRPWKQELQPTGLYVFSIRTHLDNALKHQWIDTPDTPIEKQLPDIVATLLLAGPILSERRRQREEAEKRRHEEEHRRYQNAQQIKQDKNRWHHFVNLAVRWREAETARQFLMAMADKLESCDTTFDGRSGSQWMEWARERLADYDPLSEGVEPILAQIASVTSWTYRE